MACSIKLTHNQRIALENELRFSEFRDELKSYYLGRGNAPDISLLHQFILDEVIPEYFDGTFTPQDLIDFLTDVTNGNALKGALTSMLNNTIILNTTGITDVEYASPLFDLFGSIYKAAQIKVDNKEKTEAEEEKKEILEDSSTEGLPTAQALFERKYKDREAYIQDRFKASSLTENLFRAKFVNDFFLKAVYADTDARKIVSQVQTPGQLSEIDTNLKAKRMDLFADLISRLNLTEDVNGKAVPVVMSESLLSPIRFNQILRLIEQAVIAPVYNQDQYNLENDGVLFELSNKYKNSADSKTNDELGAIVNNYIDYVIVSDYDKILEFYFPDSISVNTRVNAFDKSLRKYNLSNARSQEAMNNKWEEKVQDGIEASADLYKMIIDSIPMLNFITGLPMKENLYPTLVSEVFSNYFSRVDFQNVIPSLKGLIIEGLENNANSFTTKNVLYTMYKKFFEEDADVVTLNRNNVEFDSKNRKVSSLLATAKTDGNNMNHPLMLLITKPLEEISKVYYAEALEVLRNRPQIVYASTNTNTVTKSLMIKRVTNAINRDSDAINEVIAAYKLSPNVNTGLDGDLTFTYDGEEHTLTAGNNSAYSVDAVINLAQAVLGLDLTNQRPSPDKEFYEELKAITGPKENLPYSFLQFVRSATKVMLAKSMLYDPEVDKIISTGKGAKLTGNKIIDDMILSKDTTLNTRTPKDTILTLSTPIAHEMYDLITSSNNRYSGNRVKSTVTTLEGTTVAGFSLYNYFLGYKNNLVKHKQQNNSIVGAAENRNVLSRNPFFNDPDLLSSFFIRGAIKVKDKVKSNSSHTVLETLAYNINLGYFGLIDKALTEGRPVTAMFDPTTYSDKTTNFMPNVRNTYAGPGGVVNLFVDDNNRAVDEDVTIQLAHEAQAGYYRAYANNIIDTWKAVHYAIPAQMFFNDGAKDAFDVVDSAVTLSDKLTALNELNTTFWNRDGFDFGLKGYSAARYYADKAGVHLTNWVHFQNNTKTLDPKKISLTIKPQLIDYVKLFDQGTNTTAFKARLDAVMVKSANELIDHGFTFQGDAVRAIAKMYPDMDNIWTDNGGTSYLLKSKLEVGKITEANQINPAFRKFFYDWNFISESLLNSSLGSIYSHKGGSENAMFITMVKRNVAAGASMRRYSMGLENGIEDSTRTAFVDDIVTKLKTIHGAEDDVVDWDGAALATYTQRIKTWNSLNSHFAGDGGVDQKPFTTHIDSKTGEVGINKFADFAMTNELIRNSIGSDIDLYELHKQLYATDISKHDVTQSWRDGINLSEFTDVYKWDRKYDFANKTAGSIIKLHSIKYAGPNVNGVNQYVVSESNLTTGGGVQERLVDIATMFDLWEVLGGIDSVDITEEKTAIGFHDGQRQNYVKPSHTSAFKLVDFESYMGNKGAYIIPETYIPARNQKDVTFFAKYKKIFGTDGVVNHHLNMLLDAARNVVPTQEGLDFIGVKSDPITIAAFVKENRTYIKDFAEYIINNDSKPDEFFKWLTRPYQPFKGKNIERITTAGAQKVGQFNMNDSSTFSTSRRNKVLASLNLPEGTAIPGVTTLITHQINNMNSGVQLSAAHETEASTVTLPTQMFNAFAFKGNSLIDVNEIYNAIADIVEEGLTDTFFEGSPTGKETLNIPELVRQLGGVNASPVAAKATLLRVFKDIMERKVASDEDFTLEQLIVDTFSADELPIDDPHMFSPAVAELTNYFTKKGIKISFDGMFAILAPGSGVQQLRDVRGGYLPVKTSGGLKYKEVVKTTALTSEEYKNWKALNAYLAESGDNRHDLTLSADDIKVKATAVTEGAPRELKGQQVVITNADGTEVALSVLRSGDTHLIPEAEALFDIKNVMKQFIDAPGSDEAKLVPARDKQVYFDNKLKEYKETMSAFINGNPRAKEFYNRFMDRVRENADLQGRDDFDELYELMSNGRERRDAKIQNQIAAKDVAGLALSYEYEYLDRVSVIGKAFTYELQNFMEWTAAGLIPESLSSEHYKGPKIASGAKLSVSRGEVFAPVVMQKAFLLRNGDTIADIDRDFFLQRLMENSNIESNGADAVLTSKLGKSVYFHQGEAPLGTIESDRVGNDGGRKWFMNESKSSNLFALPKNVFVGVHDGDVHIYLRNNYTLADNPLVKNLQQAFRGEDSFGEINYFEKSEEAQLERYNERLAKNSLQADKMWNSWNEYTKIIGTRIPGQHFQSFQGLKIVGFVEGNKVYVPNEVTLLSGSDFDIDKQNIIYYSVTKQGLIQGWHPAFDHSTPEALAASLQLPLTSRRTREEFEAELDVTGRPLQYVADVNPDLDMLKVENLVAVYEAIKEGYKLHPEQHKKIIDALVIYDQRKKLIVEENGDYIGGREEGSTIDGIKNFAISRANNIIESPLNFLLLYKPVSMDTPKMFGDNSSKGAASRGRVRENPVSTAEAKYDNMVGKKVIGIMAAGGLKSLSALTVTYNNSLRDMSDLIYKRRQLSISLSETDLLKEAGVVNQLKDAIVKVNLEIEYIKTGLLGKVAVANIKYDNLDPDIITEMGLDLHPTATNLPGDLLKVNIATGKVAPQDVEALKEKAIQFLAMRGEFDADAAELLSELLSAATDNAKELILAKINATPELAGVFANMIIANEPFEYIVDVMTSPVVELIIKRAGRNLFNSNTRKNSLDNLITLVKLITNKKSAQYKYDNEQKLLRNYNLVVDEDPISDEVAVRDLEDTTNTEHKLSELTRMQGIFDQANDLRTLSKYLGINQGIRSNSWELYNFKVTIQDYVNKKLGGKFDFKRFLDSLESGGDYHRDQIIRLSDKIKDTSNFNILYVLASTPNFAKQLVAYNAANTLLNLSSYKINTVYNVVEKLRSINYLPATQNINENQYKEIEKYIDNTVIDNFIESETNMQYPKGTNQASRNKPVFYNGDTEIKINTAKGREDFTNWVVEKFLPNVKEQYKNNEFIQELITDDKTDTLLNGKYTFMHLTMDTTNVKSQQQRAYRDSYLYNLSLLYNNGDTDLQHGKAGPSDVSKQNNIFNVLFWYNMVVNKNNITKNSYAKLLGELMLRNPASNPYRRFLQLKGKLGKAEDVQIGGAINLMTSNGIEFDLFDLLDSTELHDAEMDYSGASQQDIDAQAAQEADAASDMNDDFDGNDPIENEPADDITDAGDSDLDYLESDGEAEADEDGGIPPKQRLVVERRRKAGQLGTTTVIYKGKATKANQVYASSTGAMASMVIPHSSRSRSKSMNVGTSRLNETGLGINETDAVNYQRFLLMNVHELLSNLNGKVEIQILRDGQDAVSFDPNETYDCL